MQNKFHLTQVSSNSKTGPIPVSTSSRDTCPDTCNLKGNGCYAESGPLRLHWDAVSNQRGYVLELFCAVVSMLPKRQLWRYGQAGDLPGDGHNIDTAALDKIVQANKGRHGFAFTHYQPTPSNAQAIKSANLEGFTVNLSADAIYGPAHTPSLPTSSCGHACNAMMASTGGFSSTPASTMLFAPSKVSSPG